MKNLKQIRETYDFITEKSERDQRNLNALVDAGLFEERKLPVLKKILESSADKMSGSEKRFILNLLESLITQFASDQLDEAKKTNNYLSQYDPRGPKDFPSDTDIPPVLILKRKAIRVYPDHKKVALYYAQQIDRYVSIPYGKDNIMAVNEQTSDDKKKRPVQNPKKPLPINARTDLTRQDLPAAAKYLAKQALTSNSPVMNAIINLGIYSGIRSRVNKAAATKTIKPPAPKKTTSSTSPVSDAAAGVWKQRRLEEEFQSNLFMLRERAVARAIPMPAGSSIGDTVNDLARRAAPYVARLGKALPRVNPATIGRLGTGALGTAALAAQAAWYGLGNKPAGDAAERSWELSDKSKRQKPARAGELETSGVQAARQKSAETLKALSAAGMNTSRALNFPGKGSMGLGDIAGKKAAAEKSSRALAFPGKGTTGLGNISAKRTAAETSSKALNYAGAGTTGLGVITPKKVDVDRAADAEKAAASRAASDTTKTSVEKDLALKAREQAASRAQAKAQTPAQTGSDEVVTPADVKAQSQANARTRADSISRASSRVKPRFRKPGGFRMPELPSMPQSSDKKEPGPNYQFGLKPAISTPQAVSNRSAVDRWMDIINRKANQAMMKESNDQKDDDDEVGTATTTADNKPVYNFRKKPRVGSQKGASNSAATERWMERIARQANQSMLRQQQQNESILNELKNIVENNITESVITIGEQPITINNTVAKKIVSLHEAMNKKNKKKMEDMLNESASSFNKVLTFAVRH